MKWPLLIVFPLLYLACSSPQSTGIGDDKFQAYKTYLTAHFQRIDSTNRLDSFVFIRYDTITQKNRYAAQRAELVDEAERLNDDGELLLKKYKNQSDMVRLAYDVSSNTYSMYKHDLEQTKDEVAKHQEKLNNLLKKDDSLKVLLAKADSIHPVGFEAVCFYQLRRKDLSVKKDTAFLTLNTDKNVVERDEFYKLDF